MPIAKTGLLAAARAEPGNFVMAEAAPFARRYTYHTIQPIEEVLRPDFFLPVRDQLRAGDTIRIVETDVGRLVVRRYVDVMVIAGGRHPSGVLLHVERGVVELSGTAGKYTREQLSGADSADRLSVRHRGRGRWAVMRGDDPVESGLPSRTTAEAVLNRIVGAGG